MLAYSFKERFIDLKRPNAVLRRRKKPRCPSANKQWKRVTKIYIQTKIANTTIFRGTALTFLAADLSFPVAAFGKF